MSVLCSLHIAANRDGSQPCPASAIRVDWLPAATPATTPPLSMVKESQSGPGTSCSGEAALVLGSRGAWRSRDAQSSLGMPPAIFS